MKVYKKILFRLLFGVEIVVFMWVYFFGSSGLQLLHKLQDENQHINKEILTLQAKLVDIDHQIDDLNSHDFFKEKIAREQLQMGKKDDEIYILD